MPTYEYRCQECKHTFAEVLSIKEHDKRKMKCPKCGSRKVEQLFGLFFAKTASKT